MATTWLDRVDLGHLEFLIQLECHHDNQVWLWEALRCITTMIMLEDLKEMMMLAVCFTRCDAAISAFDGFVVIMIPPVFPALHMHMYITFLDVIPFEIPLPHAQARYTLPTYLPAYFALHYLSRCTAFKFACHLA